MPPRLAVLASGRGSNLHALLDAITRGDLPATVVVVVSNNSGAPVLSLARAHQIDAVHLSGKTNVDPGAALLELLGAHHVDLVVLAGYMKRLDPRIVAAYPDRVVNIHPAPLPRFGGPGMFGLAVHAAVLTAKVPTAGPTVHLVSDDYDTGRILAHLPVPVLPTDTPESLAQRVLAAEHQLYWRTIRQHFCA